MVVGSTQRVDSVWPMFLIVYCVYVTREVYFVLRVPPWYLFVW